MAVNRYTQINPAQFTPFSMQEIFAPAAMMREQHDAAMDKAIEMEALDINRMPADDPLVSNVLGGLRGQISDVSSSLATQGFDRNVQNKLSNIRREYSRQMSPSGVLGKAQQNYMQAQEGWQVQRDALVKRGAPPDFIGRARDIYMNQNYQGVVNPDGTYNEFTPGRVPGYYDIPEEIRTYFKQVGLDKEIATNQSLGFERAPNGQFILVDRNPSSTSSNLKQLNEAIASLQIELQDPSKDRGYSAIMQNYTPEQIEELLQRTAQSFRVFEQEPPNYSYQQLAGDGMGGRGGSPDVPLTPQKSTATASQNIPVRTGKGAKSDVYVVAGQQSINFGGLVDQVPRNLMQDGRTYITGSGGANLSSNYRINDGLPTKGIHLKNAVTQGYVMGYTLDSVEPISEEVWKSQETLKKMREGLFRQYREKYPSIGRNPMTDAEIYTMVDNELSEDRRLQEDAKLANKISKITNQQNPDGGAMFIVGGAKEKYSSLPNLDQNVKPVLDHKTGEYYVHYQDGNGIIKVKLRPELFRVDKGIRGDYAEDVSKATADDMLTAYTPTSRYEALANMGVDANVPDPINVHFMPHELGDIRLVVDRNQPIWNPNHVLSMIDDTETLMNSFDAHLAQISAGYSGVEGAEGLRKALQFHGVDLLKTRNAWQLVAKQPFYNEYIGEDGNIKIDEWPSLMYLVQAMIQQTKDPNTREQERHGGSLKITLEQQQALQHVINFLAALEAISINEHKSKK